jgi:uncharacterized protein YuzE
MSRIEHRLLVKSERPPIVEFDAEARAVYIRFSERRVVKTLERTSHAPIVTVDVDKDGQVVGVEGVCFTEVTIQKLLKAANVLADRIDFSKATLRPTARRMKEHAAA